MSWVAAVVAAGTTAYGISQKVKANKLAKANVRPTYQIPKEIESNLSDAERMALGGLPDEQKQQYVNNVQRSQQFGLQGASDRKGGLAGLGTLVQQGNDAYGSMLSQDSAARQRNQMMLMQQRDTMAGYKDKAFGVNAMQPYEQRAAAARALAGAGQQNIGGGVNMGAQSAMRGMNKNKGSQGLGDQSSGGLGGNGSYNMSGMDPKSLEY